jgi:acetoacetate decarboxylase
MLYSIDKRELRAWAKRGLFLPTFRGAEMLLVGFQTDPGVLAQLLPRPLEPPDEGLAVAFVAHYPETNFGVTYREGALVVPAAFKGEVGGYCLAMPVDNDMAMVGGREHFGFPKKLADEITLERDQGHVVGRVVRHTVEILRLEAELTSDIDIGSLGRLVPNQVQDLEGNPAVPFVSFLFKHFPAADGSGFEYLPRLIRQVTLLRPREGLQSGVGKIELGRAPADPLGEIPVREIVTVVYGKFDNVMLPGRTVSTVRNPLRFAPHAFFSTDMLATVDLDAHSPMSRRARRRLRKRATSY